MPKLVYKVGQFHGGISTGSDPRDLAENELVDAQDLMVDIVGKIRTMGSNVAHDAPGAATFGDITGTISSPGYGLFQFSHDRVGGEDAGQSQAETGDDYLAFYDDNDQQVWVYSSAEDAWNDDVGSSGDGVIDIGSSGSAKPTFYFVDGALRVSDGAFGSNNTNKWYGYIERTHFNIGSPYVDAYDGWFSKDQGITSPTSGIVGNEQSSSNTDSLSDLLFGGAEGTDTNTLKATGFFAVAEADADGDAVAITTAQMAGQRALNITEGTYADINTVANIDSVETDALTSSGNWDTEDIFMIFPQAGTGFNLYVSTVESTSESEVVSTWEEGTYEVASTFIYDGNQESLPFVLASTFKITSSLNLPTFKVWATSPYNPRLTGARIYYRDSGTPDYWKLLLDLSLKEGVRGGLNDRTDTYTAWTAVSTPELTWGDWYALWDGLTDNTDNTGDRWEDMTAPTFHSTFTSAGTYLQAQYTVSEPNTAEVYESITGVLQDINTLEAKYKTAVVVNRKVFIGNIETKNEDNISEVFGDLMIQSIANKFDTFAIETLAGFGRGIDGSVRDGDSIVKLETYADRLLQFKKKKLHIFNISQSITFLEDTYMFKGVSHPAAVCKTDFGIAWVNSLGCYIFNGESISNLLEKGGRRSIKESEWTSFTTDNSIIGYVPKKRQLIVLRDCRGTFTLTGSINPTGTNTAVPGTGTKFLTELSIGDSILVSSETRIVDSITDDTTATVSVAWGSDLANDTSPECLPVGDIYLFDMVTQSWTKGDSKFTDSKIQTNFVTDWNNDLVHAHTSDTATVHKWSDASVASGSGTFSLKTKDIDFEQPSIRKKVYKVYISYKGDGDSVTIQYAVNGDTDTEAPFYRTTADGTSDKTNSDTTPLLDSDTDDWISAELRPVSSINNIYSFQLIFGGTAGADFEINDISIIYRLKSIK